jgi:hypothetical protein
VLLSLSGSGFLVAASFLVGDRHSPILTALAAVLPLMLMLDAGRYLAFAARKPMTAVMLDLSWATAQLVAVLIVVASGRISAVSLVVAAGAPAVIGACITVRSVHRIHPSTEWISRNWDLAWRFAAEWLIGTGVGYLAVLALGPLVSVAAVGAVRGVQVVFGPLNVLYAGAMAVLVPEGVRMRPQALHRALVQASLLLAGLAVAMVVIALAIPDSLGEAVLGETWSSARELVLPMGIAATFGAIMSGAVVGLRSLRAASASLNARTRLVPVLLGLPLTGGWMSGAVGFAWGSAGAAAVAALVWWHTLHRFLNSPIEVDPRR